VGFLQASAVWLRVACVGENHRLRARSWSSAEKRPPGSLTVLVGLVHLAHPSAAQAAAAGGRARTGFPAQYNAMSRTALRARIAGSWRHPFAGRGASVKVRSTRGRATPARTGGRRRVAEAGRRRDVRLRSRRRRWCSRGPERDRASDSPSPSGPSLRALGIDGAVPAVSTLNNRQYGQAGRATGQLRWVRGEHRTYRCRGRKECGIARSRGYPGA